MRAAGIIVGLAAIATVFLRDATVSDCGSIILYTFVTDSVYIDEGPHYTAPLVSFLLILSPYIAVRGPPRIGYVGFITVWFIIRGSFWFSACDDFHLGNGVYMLLVTMILSAAAAVTTDTPDTSVGADINYIDSKDGADK
tara:strand:+ start:121 stop:540 length:420 start_codon:yes stop_codon:yes gene_type:complete